MRNHSRITSTAALALPLFCLIQSSSLAQSTVGGPRLGYIWNPSASAARPILGTPGAASWGDWTPSKVALRNAAISSLGGFVIGLTDPDGTVQVASLDGSAPVALDGAIGQVDSIVLSQSGGAAALYSSASGQVQVFSGLPTSPQIALRTTLPSPPRSLVVSNDGSRLLAAVLLSDSLTLTLVTPDGSQELLTDASAITAMTFMNESPDAILADSSSGRLLRIHQNGSSEPYASVPSVVAAMAFNAGDSRLIFSDGATITAFETADSTTHSVMCSCASNDFSQLGSSLFRTGDPARGPLWVIDASTADLKLTFIPSAGGSNE